MVEDAQDAPVVEGVYHLPELLQQGVVDFARAELVYELAYVGLEGGDAGEAGVDFGLHAALHLVAHMLERLRRVLLRELLYDVLLHAGDHAVGVLAAQACHGAHHPLHQEDVLHLGHVGDEDVLAAQVSHLGVGAPVAVHYAVAVEVVQPLEVGEGACGLYHLVAGPQGAHREV